MDVIIFGGQSNMQGQTEGCPIVNEEVKNAYEYRKQINEIIPLKHPVGEDFTWEKLLLSSHNGGGSLVPDFCHIYAKKTGRKVLAIHVARGSTTIAEWQKGTQRYHVMAEKIKRGIEKASEIEKVEHIYYVWLQGESDAIIETTKEDYLESLIRYKNNLKKDFNIEKFGIIKVGYFFSTSQWHTKVSTFERKKACDEEIMLAQENACKIDNDFVMLSRICEKLSLNKEYINPEASGHYNNKGMEIIGKEAGANLAKL